MSFQPSEIINSRIFQTAVLFGCGAFALYIYYRRNQRFPAEIPTSDVEPSLVEISPSSTTESSGSTVLASSGPTDTLTDTTTSTALQTSNPDAPYVPESTAYVLERAAVRLRRHEHIEEEPSFTSTDETDIRPFLAPVSETFDSKIAQKSNEDEAGRSFQTLLLHEKEEALTPTPDESLTPCGEDENLFRHLPHYTKSESGDKIYHYVYKKQDVEDTGDDVSSDYDED